MLKCDKLAIERHLNHISNDFSEPYFVYHKPTLKPKWKNSMLFDKIYCHWTADILANACLIYSFSLNQINNEQRIALFVHYEKVKRIFVIRPAGTRSMLWRPGMRCSSKSNDIWCPLRYYDRPRLNEFHYLRATRAVPLPMAASLPIWSPFEIHKSE